MLSIVIPTYNSSLSLKKTIESLVPPPYAREIVVVDGGSQDDTRDIALECGARFVKCEKGRGHQLKAGGEEALGEWLLFLHADTVLPPDWGREVSAFIANKAMRERAAYFTFSLDDESAMARKMEKGVSWRCRWLGLPYGDQGLLISKDLYERVGGFSDIPLMEDVDLIRRIGKKRLHGLNVKALTSASKYQAQGYGRRIMRNLTCLGLYFLGLSPHRIVKLYE